MTDLAAFGLARRYFKDTKTDTPEGRRSQTPPLPDTPKTRVWVAAARVLWTINDARSEVVDKEHARAAVAALIVAAAEGGPEGVVHTLAELERGFL